MQAAAALTDELRTHGLGADEAGWHARIRALQITLEGPTAGEATYEAALRACRRALTIEAVAVLTAASRPHPYAPRIREALAYAAGAWADAALRAHEWGRAELAVEAEVEAATRWRALEPESGSAMEALARAHERRLRLANAVGDL